MTKKLKNEVNKILEELVINLSDGLIDETIILEELNSLVAYNDSFKPFIYELFFSKAIELNKIPKLKSLVLSLFKGFEIESILLTDDFSNPGVRSKVLKELNLSKSLKLYQYFLICNIDESYLNFKNGEKDEFFVEAKKTNPSIKDIFDSINSEL